MGKNYYDPRFDGEWPIQSAKTHAGHAYTGTMTIKAAECDGHRIDWKTTAGTYDGIGLVIDGRLWIGFGKQDEGYGLAVYTETAEGIESVFTSQHFKGAVGRETIIGCPGFGHLDKQYATKGWQPDKISYTGQVAFAVHGDIFLITWAFEGTPGELVGAGMVRHGKFVTGYGFRNVFSFGCGCYELQPDGSLMGEWAIPAFTETELELYGKSTPLKA